MLSQQETLCSCSDDELEVGTNQRNGPKLLSFQTATRLSSELNAPCHRPRPQVQRQTLLLQLQDAQQELAAERQESRNTRTRAEFLDRELLQVREQLEKMIVSHEQEQRKSGKQEVRLCV